LDLRQVLLDFCVHNVIIPDGGEIASPWVGFREVNQIVDPDWSRSD
jgi:hypothetical protein